MIIAADATKEIEFEIGHVLFIDIAVTPNCSPTRFDCYKFSSLRVRFIISFEGNSSSSTFRAISTPATGSFSESNSPTWTRIEA